MEIYILAGVSFAIMFFWRYSRDIIFIVRRVADTHNVQQRDTILTLAIAILFIMTTILFPAYALKVYKEEKIEVVKRIAREILLTFYGLELKSIVKK